MAGRNAGPERGRRAGATLVVRDRERGAGTVVAAGLSVVLLLLLAGVLGLAQAGAAASKAATAADLAALAAADAARGLAAGDPCQVAADLASRHGAALTSCRVLGPWADTVQVEVSVRTTLPWPARGLARAGPPSVP
ncbi:Rv3654c family TadE-like protein [Arthrobacter dokdonensis]|uniref:Rv3654c family TadE-like protein n=1 Tax=Arthrobacter dokdonellae TaxID=2211210 RepID=UPI000DE5BDC5|nr:Rv3654c family TadE-like protein [Arthrobacter dokdonellae]